MIRKSIIEIKCLEYCIRILMQKRDIYHLEGCLKCKEGGQLYRKGLCDGITQAIDELNRTIRDFERLEKGNNLDG